MSGEGGKGSSGKLDTGDKGLPRFICDNMLGSLARWLRFLGYDTMYPEAMDDTKILKLARSEGRFLITRDIELSERAGADGMLVTSKVLEEQLEQVKGALHLDLEDGGLLSRCSLCNTPLEKACRDELRGKVPDAVLARHDDFWRCPGCFRVYWPGSHYESILRKLGALEKK